ncbi:MAG: AI-2E family transporter [Candidatus Azambacteria bacterium]|nr:AI-2E family transporter [Candidatus Azambacteria bacterium]
MDSQRLQTFFFLSLLLGIGALVLFVLMPYLTVIIISGTLAVVLYPLYQRILRIIPPYESLASLITVLIALLIIFIPLFLFGATVVKQAGGLYLSITNDGKGTSFIQETIQVVQEKVRLVSPNAVIDIDQSLEQLLGWIVGKLGVIFSGVTSVIIGFVLSMLALYYLLKDGKKLEEVLITLSPLKDTDDRDIFNKLAQAVHSVIWGTLVVALVQGVLVSVGFYIFGVPNGALWGSVAAIAALIPFIGTTLIVFPAVLYLFIFGDTLSALGLLVWGATAVGLVDNILTPKLLSRGIRIHPLLILFSVLGGLSFFGPAGFLIGPLLLSLLFALLDIYRKQLTPSI